MRKLMLAMKTINRLSLDKFALITLNKIYVLVTSTVSLNLSKD